MNALRIENVLHVRSLWQDMSKERHAKNQNDSRSRPEDVSVTFRGMKGLFVYEWMAFMYLFRTHVLKECLCHISMLFYSLNVVQRIKTLNDGKWKQKKETRLHQYKHDYGTHEGQEGLSAFLRIVSPLSLHKECKTRKEESATTSFRFQRQLQDSLTDQRQLSSVSGRWWASTQLYHSMRTSS